MDSGKPLFSPRLWEARPPESIRFLDRGIGSANRSPRRPMPHAASSAVLFARLMAKSRLRHLQLLVAVADEGNLKRAAADIGLSQPAATQALSELEELLEVPLFERHAKGMRITAAGLAVIPVIRHALEALQCSTDTLEALREGVSGRLRLGVITAVASALGMKPKPSGSRSWPCSPRAMSCGPFCRAA